MGSIALKIVKERKIKMIKKKPAHGGERAVVNQRKVTGGRFVSLGSVSELIKAETKQTGREFSRCKKNEHVYDRTLVRVFFFFWSNCDKLTMICRRRLR